MVPGKVTLSAKVVQVSAGDSHTAALTDDGTVYIWGSYRVSYLLLATCVCVRDVSTFPLVPPQTALSTAKRSDTTVGKIYLTITVNSK